MPILRVLHNKKLGKLIRFLKTQVQQHLNSDANDKMPRFCCNVSVFKEPINFAPYQICVVCNHYLYRKSVDLFNRNKFCAISDDIFSLVSSFNDNFYICQNCGKKLNQNSIPCEAVYNMFEVCELLKEFRDIRRLETVLVPMRLLFKKIISCRKVSLRCWKVHYVIYQQM